MGVIQDMDPVNLRAAVYYYDIKDFINDNGITSPGTGFGSNCLYNIPHFRLWGGEIEASIHLGRFQGTLSYNYQNYSYDETGFEQDWTYYLPALLPHNKVKFLGNYEVWRDGLVQLAAIYVGDRDSQQAGTGSLPSYFTLDFGFQQTFHYGGVEWQAETYCNNFTGANYQEISGYQMPKYVWGFMLSARF